MLQPAIVKVLSRDRQLPLGCGVAVAPRGHVVTCAHVVADALRVPRDTRQLPDGAVEIGFPFNDFAGTARVVAWSPVNDADVAVLACPLPESIRSIPLFQAPITRSQRFRTFGFPKGYPSGRWGYGELLDSLPGGLIQVASSELAPGFSGGPVEDLQMARLIGLLSAYDSTLGTGFIIPAGQIARIWPQVHLARVESRFSPFTDGLMGLPGDPLTGLEQFLQEYLGVADAPRPFGGRQIEFDQLDQWLASPHEPAAAIIAPAGRGKSALVTRWMAHVAAEKRAEVAFVPISIRFNTAQKVRSTMLLGARLTYLAEGGTRKLASSDPDQWIGEIGQRLRENRPPGEPPLLIVLDGLDEATDWRAGVDLSIPSTLGDGIKVLISARILAQDRGPEEWIERLGWPAFTRCIDLPPLSSAGVGDVLRSMGNPLHHLAADIDMVTELTRLSEGDPLLVSLYVEALRGSEKHEPFLKPADLVELDRGLDGYFDAWWRDQRRQWGSRSPLKEASVLAALNVFACALAPLGEADLLAVAGEDLNSWLLTETLETLARFVIGDGHEQGFCFSHPRLSQYFYHRLSRPEREEWNKRFADYGRTVVGRLRARAIPPQDAPAYVLMNHTAHLERTAATPADYYALLEEPWVRAWEHLDGSFTGYIRDVLRAWDVADREHQVYWQIFCAFCHSSIVSLHAAPPPSLIARALKEKLFNEAQVLGLLQRMEDESSQAGVIQAIAPLLKMRALQTVVALARRFQKSEARVGALASLIPYLPDIDAIQLVQAATDLDPGTQILDAAINAAVTSKNSQIIEEVLQAADHVQSEQSRAELLFKLIPHLSPRSHRYLLNRSAFFAEPAARALLLAGLSSYVPQDLLPDAIRAAAGIWYSYRRALALIALLEHAPKDWKAQVADHALEACSCVTEDDRKAEVLIRLATNVPEPLSASLLAQALQIIEQSVGGTRRIALLSLFPDQLPDSIATALIRASQKWTDPLQQIRLLVRMAHSAIDPRPALRSALQACHALQEPEKSLAIELVAQESPPDFLPELLEGAKAMRCGAEGMIFVASFLDPLRQTEVVECYKYCFHSYNSRESHRPPWVLAGKVTERLCDAARRIISNAIPDSYSDSWSRETDIGAFRTRVLIARDPGDLDELLQSASQFKSRQLRASALDLLTPILDHDRLDQAITLAWKIGAPEPDWYSILPGIQAGEIPGFNHDQAEILVGASSEYPSTGIYLWACALSLFLSGDTVVVRERLKDCSASQRLWFAAQFASWFQTTTLSELLHAWNSDLDSPLHELGESLLEDIASKSPESCVPRLFEAFTHANVSPRLTLLLALRMPADARGPALESALASVAQIEYIYERTRIVESVADRFDTLSVSEFDIVLAAARRFTRKELDLGFYLRSTRAEVRRDYARRMLQLEAKWDVDFIVEYIRTFVPLVGPSETRQLLEQSLDVANIMDWFLELLHRTPEIPTRAMRAAVSLLEKGETESVLSRLLGSPALDSLLPALIPLSPTLDPPMRAAFMAQVIEPAKEQYPSGRLNMERWRADDLALILPRLTSADATYLLEHTAAWFEAGCLISILGLVEPAAQPEVFRSVLGERSWFEDQEISQLARILPASVILPLIRNSPYWERANWLRALVPYLGGSDISQALEVFQALERADAIRDERDKHQLLFLLLTRLEPAQFVREFRDSPLFLSRHIWISENRLNPTFKMEAHFENAESFSRTLRLLGSLNRPQFSALLGAVLHSAVEFGGAEFLRGLLEANAKTVCWWP